MSLLEHATFAATKALRGVVRYAVHCNALIAGTNTTTNVKKKTKMTKRRTLTWEIDPDTQCWNCTSHAIGPYGYPTGCYIDGRRMNMHRAVFQILFGELKSTEFVLHSCDNRKCINPEHLRKGSAADNSRDMLSRKRGRWLRGENQPNARLTERQVQDIRNAHASGRQQIELARIYGMNPSHISRICSGKKWGYLAKDEHDVECRAENEENEE